MTPKQAGKPDRLNKMTHYTIISHYNHLNGKSVTTKEAKSWIESLTHEHKK